MAAERTDWIAVDWGTTHLRVWVYGPDGAELAELASDDGMGRLAPGDFEPALLALIGAHLPEGRATQVICCGMVGARQGWVEAAYASTPCPPPGVAQAVRVPARDTRLDVHILPGVQQDDPADVMRGEETQIAGVLAEMPEFDGVLCLPGTHTKWVRVSAGEIVGFRTYMTGELFALLAEHSVLRHGVGTGWEEAAFDAGVAAAMTRPEGLSAALFGLRAEGLLRGLAPDATRARLSGLLIGLELAGARPYWLGQRVALVGAAALTRLYQAALAGQGLQAEVLTGDRMTLKGLAAAHQGV